MISGIGRDFPDLRVLEGALGCGVRFAVSTRDGGASSGEFARGNLADHVGDEADAVARNRAEFGSALGAHRGLAVIAAAHGASTAWVSEPGTYRDVDALVTDVAGLGIVALGADCAVVGIAAIRDDGSQIVGVVHCGWRGLVADVVGVLVGDIRRAGGRNLEAVVGPTICGSCYLVDAVRSESVRQACTPGVATASVRPSSTPGMFELDIRSGVHQRLGELDVVVRLDCGCTAEDDRWFSYRSTITMFGPDANTGRHGLGLVIDELQ